MVTQLSDLNPDATYSYADYFAWRLNERVELIKGHLVKMAAPCGDTNKSLVNYTAGYFCT